MLILISLSDNRGLDKQWHSSVKIAEQSGVKRTSDELAALFKQLVESLSQPASEDIAPMSEAGIDDVSSQLDELSISSRNGMESSSEAKFELPIRTARVPTKEV